MDFCDIFRLGFESYVVFQFLDLWGDVVMPATVTYLCLFNINIKTKCYLRLDAENDERLKLSATVPSIAELCTEMQMHPSH